MTTLTLRSTDDLQFFVRFTDHERRTRSLVLIADASETISLVHQKIQSFTGIPVSVHQRLIYQGKHLNPEQTLHACGVRNDAGLHLLLLPGGHSSTRRHPLTFTLILVSDILSYVSMLLNNNQQSCSQSEELVGMVSLFLFIEQDPDFFLDHMQIFNKCSVTDALVTLYTSSDNKTNKGIATDAIEMFIMLSTEDRLPISKRIPPIYCIPVVLKFCKLLREAMGANDLLYEFCETGLAKLVKLMPPDDDGEINNLLLGFHDAVSFVAQLSTKISCHLEANTASCCVRLNLISRLQIYTSDLAAFLVPVRNKIMGLVEFYGPIRVPLINKELPACYVEEVIHLHQIFINLLNKMDKCLMDIETRIESESWYYLCILKELYNTSKLYYGCEEVLWETMKRRKNSLSYVIVKYAYRDEDHTWILRVKEVTNFEARNHLSLMLLPELEFNYEKTHDMLIDRSDLLASSFRCMGDAEPKSLRDYFSVTFKNEEADGRGVLREWLLLFCQEIFDPKNNLFVACPNDRKRFFPNAAFDVDSLHLKNLRVAGRVIALALMYKLQVCIRLDRIFFLQLAGHGISLEDIQNADPFMYNSCKRILEMDPEILDQDALGLTFVHEIDEFGKKKVVELCPGGRDIVVNSENRELYVHLLIEYIFVTAISEQVASFAQGFDDIVTQDVRKSYLQSLYLEDLDLILHGRESGLSVDDWKEHTDYYGPKGLISWFWEIVGSMSEEQKRVLLFFWTSIKNLPFEGFSGLDYPLHISRTSESTDHLPSSKTCSYRLFIPDYTSFSIMRDRLHIITQEHIGFSFGLV